MIILYIRNLQMQIIFQGGAGLYLKNRKMVLTNTIELFMRHYPVPDPHRHCRGPRRFDPYEDVSVWLALKIKLDISIWVKVKKNSRLNDSVLFEAPVGII